MKVPPLAAQADGHHAVVLARREIHAPCIADILDAQHALGVAGRRLQPLQRDGFGVFFRLCEVDGHFQRAILPLVIPLDVSGNLRSADIVGRNAQPIEIIGGGAGTLFFPQGPESFAHLALARHYGAHDARFKIHTQGGHAGVKQAPGRRGIQQAVQDGGGRRLCLGGHRPFPWLGQAEQVQKRVAADIYIQRGNQAVPAGKIQQAFHQQCSVVHVACSPLAPAAQAALFPFYYKVWQALAARFQ